MTKKARGIYHHVYSQAISYFYGGLLIPTHLICNITNYRKEVTYKTSIIVFPLSAKNIFPLMARSLACSAICSGICQGTNYYIESWIGMGSDSSVTWSVFKMYKYGKVMKGGEEYGTMQMEQFRKRHKATFGQSDDKQIAVVIRKAA